MQAHEYSQSKRNCAVLWALTALAIAAQIVAEETTVFTANQSVFRYVSGALVALTLLSIGLLASMRRRREFVPGGLPLD